jgi:N-acetylglutamate synthase-like GNAT family acetyltransferase
MILNSAIIRITAFSPEYQTGIDNMLDIIQTEYAESFFHQPVRKMEALYLQPNRYYWVALANEKVIGTVGIVVAEGYAVLKSLFVDSVFRGEGMQVAYNLIKTATDTAKQHGAKYIYLGTMAQFKSAQRFYEKHGYNRIQINELPTDYPHNPIDTIFYRMQLD